MEALRDDALDFVLRWQRVRLQPLRYAKIVISSELGMRPFMERVLSRREILRA